MTVNFGDKLTLVLKILLVSRTRLAADLGVDKSIVSRWCSGANAPSGENLSQLTRLIGARVPGFTALDWDGDLATLARRLKMPPTDAVHSIPDDFAQWLETPALATAAAGSMTMSRACAGIWRTTRPFPAMPGHYIREYVLMQPRPGGLLRFRMGLLDVRIEGWSYCVGNQAFSCAINQTNGDAVFTIFHWRGSERAELIDGITLSPGGDHGGHIYAAPCVMERVGELSGNADADERRFIALTADDPLAAPDDVPPAIRAHLSRTFAPVPGDAGSLLTIPFAASMARGFLQPAHAPWAARPAVAAGAV
jgi:hypothetical protein